MTTPQMTPVQQAQYDLDNSRKKQTYTDPVYLSQQQLYAQTYGQNNTPKTATAASGTDKSVWTQALQGVQQYGDITSSSTQASVATAKSQKAEADLKRWQDNIVASQKTIADSYSAFQKAMTGKYPAQAITYTKKSGGWVDQNGKPVDAHTARVINNNIKHGLNADGTPKITQNGNDGIPSAAGQYIYSDPKDAQIAAWARQAGWAEDQIPTVIGIAQAESSRSNTATHPNSNGSTDYGLMQINTIHRNDGGAINANFFSGGGWKDPVQNLAAALQIYKARGNSYKDWVTFQNGDYTGYHPQYIVAKPSLNAANMVSGGQLTADSTGLRSKIITQGLKYLGTPYVYAGDSLTQGVDCSGLVHSLYQMFGFNLPRTAREDARPGGGDGYGAWTGNVPGHIVGTITSKNQLDSSLKVGDLLTFKGAYLGPNEFGHVGIYVGNGQMLESPDTGLTVRVRSIRDSEYSSGNMRGIHLTLPGDGGQGTNFSTPNWSP